MWRMLQGINLSTPFTRWEGPEMSAIKALIIGVAPASLLLSACSAEVMTAFVDGMA
jgi:hypothetical protein